MDTCSDDKMKSCFKINFGVLNTSKGSKMVGWETEKAEKKSRKTRTNKKQTRKIKNEQG
jgi:hypothetical protein